MNQTALDPEGVTRDGARTEPSDRLGQSPWALSVQIVVVGSALMPVVGALVRWIAFRFDDRLYSALAVAAPVPELAFAGFVAVLPALVLTAALVALVRVTGSRELRRRSRVRAALRSFDERLDEAKARHEQQKMKDVGGRFRAIETRVDALPADTEPDEELAAEMRALAEELPDVATETRAVDALLDKLEADGQVIDRLLGVRTRPERRWRDWRWYRSLLTGFASVAVLVLQLVFTIDLVAVLPTIAGSMVALVYLMWAELGRPARRTLAPAFWALLIILGCSALASGLSGAVSNRAMFIPASSGAVSSGWYSIVGQTDPYVYLLPCEGSAPLVAMRTDDLPTYSFAATPGGATPDVTVWSLVRDGVKPTFGYVSRSCPHH
jgi:hypothetical protein